MKLALIGALIGAIITIMIITIFDPPNWICFASGAILSGTGTVIGLFLSCETL